MKLPTYDEVLTKTLNGVEKDAIEQFIFSNEPAGEAEKEFRAQLEAALSVARADGYEAAKKQALGIATDIFVTEQGEDTRKDIEKFIRAMQPKPEQP